MRFAILSGPVLSYEIYGGGDKRHMGEQISESKLNIGNSPIRVGENPAMAESAALPLKKEHIPPRHKDVLSVDPYTVVIGDELPVSWESEQDRIDVPQTRIRPQFLTISDDSAYFDFAKMEKSGQSFLHSHDSWV